ncbi:bifunctional adenosylcobinamide kinase/adenosylcobinamide-phosphate guanylyltransferase [Propioniciclava soli]|uniref:bifunctional adenosylcobinamide kinase/adenosylcobinamide-phosphate guanylyltransferase n=1 Tax=Propioniciclava soli TaxID=2775081 RepID=UPI001E2C581E
MRRLVIGGARSGKSRFAEQLVADAASVDYVATSEPRVDDPEWAERIAAHVARRPASWRSVETVDLAAVLGEGPGSGSAEQGAVVLIDCLTVWLTRVMDACGCWEADAAEGLRCLGDRVDELVAALERTGRDVVLVTNEVGQGVVPATASGRLFRDQMGIVNARVAAVTDEVWWLVAGLPTRLKP